MFEAFVSSRLTYRPYTMADWPEIERHLAIEDIAFYTLTLRVRSVEWKAQFAPEVACPTRAIMFMQKDHAIIGALNFGGRECFLQFGYWLMPEYRGMGYAVEGVAALLRHLRTLPSLVRAQALVEPENLASIRVLEASGFEREGVLRSYRLCPRRERAIDVCMYAKLLESGK